MAFSTNQQMNSTKEIKSLEELDREFEKLSVTDIQNFFKEWFEKGFPSETKLFLKLMDMFEKKMELEKQKDVKTTPDLNKDKKPESPHSNLDSKHTKSTNSPIHAKKEKAELIGEYKKKYFVFDRIIIKNDGDCALTAMGLTRQDAANLLEENIPKNDYIRQLIAPEIKAAIFENNFKHIVKNTKAELVLNDLLVRRQALDMKKQELMSSGKEVLSREESKDVSNLISLNKVLQQNKDKINNKYFEEISKEIISTIQKEEEYHKRLDLFSSNPDVQLTFIRQHIKTTGWLTFNADESTSSMDAIAELNGKHILIFYNDEKTNVLKLIHEHAPLEVKNCDILFFTDHLELNTDGTYHIHKNVHFDKLMPQDRKGFIQALDYHSPMVNDKPETQVDEKSKNSASTSSASTSPSAFTSISRMSEIEEAKQKLRDNGFGNNRSSQDTCTTAHFSDSKYDMRNRLFNSAKSSLKSDEDRELLYQFFKIIVDFASKNQIDIDIELFKKAFVYFSTADDDTLDKFTLKLYPILEKFYSPEHSDYFEPYKKEIAKQMKKDVENSKFKSTIVEALECNDYLCGDLKMSFILLRPK